MVAAIYFAVPPTRCTFLRLTLPGEVLKARNDHRLAPTLHYWRDQIGVEGDLLLDHGDTLTPVEFKAGQTVAADWAEPLNRYRSRALQRWGRPTAYRTGTHRVRRRRAAHALGGERDAVAPPAAARPGAAAGHPGVEAAAPDGIALERLLRVVSATRADRIGILTKDVER